MKKDATLAAAIEIMTTHAARTGLSPASESPRRYLWTDAFAVCNFLALYRQTHDEIFRNLAQQLVDQVHRVLGRHRDDDLRTGWISGLSEQEGKLRPTAGGLRIGKKRNERGIGDPYDERLEWDRDGQYFHYLTKWMLALDQAGNVTGNPIYHKWALELAGAAHAGFVLVPSAGGLKHLCWKMSIDLSYPLVPSMGHHDPLDGYLTYCQLQASKNTPEAGLAGPIADMRDICRGKRWETSDPLGIGGLLCDAYRAAQLKSVTTIEPPNMPEILLDAALQGLETFANNNSQTLHAAHRLPFRELGMAIGLKAVMRLEKRIKTHPELLDGGRDLRGRVKAVMRYTHLADDIEGFWREPENQKADNWAAHPDINAVMLVTSMMPDGYLTLQGPAS